MPSQEVKELDRLRIEAKRDESLLLGLFDFLGNSLALDPRSPLSHDFKGGTERSLNLTLSLRLTLGSPLGGVKQ